MSESDDAVFYTSTEEDPSEPELPLDEDLEAGPELRVRIRHLPRVARQGLRLVWTAGRRDLITVAILQVIGGFDIAALLILGRFGLDNLIEVVQGQGALRSVTPYALALAGLTAFNAIVNALQQERQQLLGELVSRHIEERILEVTTEVELEVFDDPAFHNRIQRIQREGHRPLQLVWGLSGLTQGGLGVAGVLVAFLAVAPPLVPLLAVVVFPVWLSVSRRSHLFFRFIWKMTPKDRERAYLFGLLTGREEAKEVRAFGTAPYLWSRYRALYLERLAELRRVARKSALYAVTNGMVIGVVMAAMLMLVVWLTLSGNLSLADAGIAVAGVGVVGGRLAVAGNSAGSLAQAGLYLEDYRAFLQMRPKPIPKVTEPAFLQAASDGPGSTEGFHQIDVEGLSFSYPTSNDPAVEDISMSIGVGEVVALVGENGSGKTTLAKLLARLYLPQKGTISWDGVDVATMDPDITRTKVAVIFQDFLHYHLPARENISLGRWQARDDLDSIHRAAEQAGADAFLTQLKEQYDTWLGPEFAGGTDLSIGQWQRIALARAFFRDAPFIILDEPTAALDARAEHELFEKIRTLLKGRTVLLISHRFSSVRSADRIYVLHEGRIIESGTHDELMQLQGRYSELFSLQAAAYLEPPRPAAPDGIGPA